MSGSRLSAEVITAILAMINIDQAEIEQRKLYLELSTDDAALLRRLQARMHAQHEQLLERFYTHLHKFEPTQRLLTDPNTVERLKQSQRRYFEELTAGVYDWDYVVNRLRVGLAHQQIGLTPLWYIGSYCKFLVEMVPEVFSATANDPETTLQALQAMLRVAFLDISLALDAYNFADRQSLLDLQALTENIICSVPAGLMVLDKELKIISSNSFFDQFYCGGHAQLSGICIDAILPGIGLAGRIAEVMRHGGSQSGISHSWQDVKGQAHQVNITIVAMNKTRMRDGVGAQQQTLLVIEDLTESERLRDATLQADHRVRAIMENAAEGIISIDERGSIESFNKAAEQLFGYSASEVIGRNVNMLMPEPYQSQHDGYLQRFQQTGERRCMNRGFREVLGLAQNGRIFDMELSISEIPGKAGRLFIGIVRDVSERKQAEAEMAKLSQALAQSADSVMITNRLGIVEYVNHGFEQTTGYSAKEIQGKSPALLKSGVQDTDFYRHMWQTMLSGEVYRGVLVNLKKDRSLYYEEKTITPLKNTKGEITHFISTGRDITERMRTQERLQFMAQHDILTSLPNRLLFMDRISQAIKQATRNDRLLAVIFMDLDRFKKINDTLGHHIGDAMLVTLSQRLAGALRHEDTVARLSGDEFAILLPDLTHADDIIPVINKILAQLKIPICIDQNELFITSSIGISIFPVDGRDPHTLVKNADTAMYHAKHLGRGTYSYYTRNMNALAEENLFLENELSQALLRKQFYLVYQPQLCLRSNTLLGVEVLLRWRHPERGLIMPDDFISLLEDTGLIIPIGEWILLQACSQLCDWHRRGIQIPRVAVNISARQLTAKSFSQRILDTITQCSLLPQHLELEITENSLIEDESGVAEILLQLHRAGVQIAMDDFGTGYSSLSYLRQLPVSSLKIDRSFIGHDPYHMDNDKLTNAIIAMGRSLNLNVVAEGVESIQQYEFLSQSGCDAAQGYFISPPLEATALEQFIVSTQAALRH